MQALAYHDGTICLAVCSVLSNLIWSGLYKTQRLIDWLIIYLLETSVTPTNLYTPIHHTLCDASLFFLGSADA